MKLLQTTYKDLAQRRKLGWFLMALFFILPSFSKAQSLVNVSAKEIKKLPKYSVSHEVPIPAAIKTVADRIQNYQEKSINKISKQQHEE